MAGLIAAFSLRWHQLNGKEWKVNMVFSSQPFGNIENPVSQRMLMSDSGFLLYPTR